MKTGDRFESTLSGLKVKVLSFVDEKKIKVKCREPDGYTFNQIIFKATLEGDTFEKIVESEYDKQKCKLKL